MSADMNNIWLAILAAAIISYLLRALPFIASRLTHKTVPWRVEWFLQLCSYSIIGSLVAESVFAPVFALHLDALNLEHAQILDVALRLMAIGFAFVFMLRFQRSTLGLVVTFSLFVMLHVLFIQGGLSQ